MPKKKYRIKCSKFYDIYHIFYIKVITLTRPLLDKIDLNSAILLYIFSHRYVSVMKSVRKILEFHFRSLEAP